MDFSICRPHPEHAFRNLDLVTGAPPSDERARERGVKKVDRHRIVEQSDAAGFQVPERLRRSVKRPHPRRTTPSGSLFFLGYDPRTQRTD